MRQMEEEIKELKEKNASLTEKVVGLKVEMNCTGRVNSRLTVLKRDLAQENTDWEVETKQMEKE